MENTINTEEIRKCCFTGYRPSKFPFSLAKNGRAFREFENTLIEKILTLIDENCLVFYSGMAMGFDIIAAETVLLVRRAYNYKIKLIAVIPFENQADSFTSHWRERYENVLNECDEKIVLSQDYFSGCYQKRNVFMVDNSDYVLTWYDGKSGGTRNTLEYATKKGRFIMNANEKECENFALQTTFEII